MKLDNSKTAAAICPHLLATFSTVARSNSARQDVSGKFKFQIWDGPDRYQANENIPVTKFIYIYNVGCFLLSLLHSHTKAMVQTYNRPNDERD
jgi:hypothetical protein